MKDRRKFLSLGIGAGFLGLFGKSTQAAPEENTVSITKTGKKGAFVYTINVGMLPPMKAEAFIERLKDKFRKQGSLNKDFDHLFIPIRNQDTKVEVHLYDRDGKAPNYIYTPTYEWEEATDEQIKKWKAQAIEYTLLMLGAPVTTVEVDKEAISKLYDSCWQTVENYGRGRLESTIYTSRVGSRRIASKN